MKDLIPEIELIRYKEVCSDMITKVKICPEGHFGLGKILAHEGKFDFAIHHLKLALDQSQNDKFYRLWYVVVMILNLEDKHQAMEAKNICYSTF